MAALVDFRAVRRALRRLLLETASPATWRKLYRLLGILTFMCFVLQFWSPLGRPARVSSVVASLTAVGTTASANISVEQRTDMQLHPEQHWRMLLPGCCGNFEGFVASLSDALRARPLGRPCLDEALDKVAPLLGADTLWLEF